MAQPTPDAPLTAEAGDDAAPSEDTLDTAERARIEALIATLEDDGRRTELIDSLRLLLEIPAEGAGAESAAPVVLETLAARVLDLLQGGLGDVGRRLAEIGRAVTDLPALAAWVEQQATSEAARHRWAAIAKGLALALVIAVAAAWLTRWLLRPLRRRLERPGPPIGRFGRVGLLTVRALLDMLPVVVLAVVGYGVITGDDNSYAARLVSAAFVNALILGATVLVLARALLAPGVAHLRLPAFDDDEAAALYGWVRRITIAALAGFLIAETGLTLGLSPGVQDALLALAGLVLAGMLIVLILQQQAAVGRLISGDTAAVDRLPGAWRRLRRLAGDVWHVLAIAYIAVAYAIFALSIEGGFAFLVQATVLTAIVLLGTHLVTDAALAGLARLALVSRRAAGPNRAGAPTDPDRVVPQSSRIVRLVAFGLALVVILDIWGLGTLALLRGATGRALLGNLATIAIILALSLGAWALVNRLIAGQLARADQAGAAPGQTQRLRTLLPLLRNVVMVVLVTIVGFMVLSELGIDIAPLLAGAGVVGLAIGFGAQTLVKDVISGLFSLFENTIAVGDVVQLGGHAGLVEGMTIRAVKLRDLAGNVHTVPFGEVTSIVNMTRGFSYYLFDIGVAYREDVDQVMTVIAEIGETLQQDKPYADLILAPIEILGVDAFTDSAVVIKARIKTTPINQWTVGREFNRRLKKRFDELGIEIPFPHTTVYFGEDRQGRAPAGRLQLMAPELAAALAAREEAATDPAPPSLKKPVRPTARRGDDPPASSTGDDGD